MLFRRIVRLSSFSLKSLFILVLAGLTMTMPPEVTSAWYMRLDEHDYERNGSVDVAYPRGSGLLACAFQPFWKAHSEAVLEWLQVLQSSGMGEPMEKSVGLEADQIARAIGGTTMKSHI